MAKIRWRSLRSCSTSKLGKNLFFLLTGRAEIVKEQVKNCPFCKSEDVGSSKVQAGSNSYHVCCFECGVSEPVANSREEAVKLWNREMDND